MLQLSQLDDDVDDVGLLMQGEQCSSVRPLPVREDIFVTVTVHEARHELKQNHLHCRQEAELKVIILLNFLDLFHTQISLIQDVLVFGRFQISLDLVAFVQRSIVQVHRIQLTHQVSV